MSDLIDRQRVLDAIRDKYCDICDHRELCDVCETEDCLYEILNAPTIDAVPVVRCKDCRYSVDLYQDGSIYCVCPNTSTPIEWHGNNPNYYCADGKERDNSEQN